MTKVHLPLQAIPAVITDSAPTVLAAHGFIIADNNGVPLTPERAHALYLELGRNVSQALTSIDENPENL